MDDKHYGYTADSSDEILRGVEDEDSHMLGMSSGEKQTKEMLGRNAMGIKAVNERLGMVARRVDEIVSVNNVHSGHIAKLERQMRLDGALEFAESFQSAEGGTLALNPLKLFKGAVKSGMLGDAKGALGNPVFVGLLAFVLSQPEILGGLLGRLKPSSGEDGESEPSEP